jgi:hypothetical protein
MVTMKHGPSQTHMLVCGAADAYVLLLLLSLLLLLLRYLYRCGNMSNYSPGSSVLNPTIVIMKRGLSQIHMLVCAAVAHVVGICLCIPLTAQRYI